MESKPRILILFTNHRVAEKLYHAIPELSRYFTLDILCIGLFSNETRWIGDSDERLTFFDSYGKYFDKIVNGPGLRYHGDKITSDLSHLINIDEYKLVIYDDNRAKPEYNIPNFYAKLRVRGIKMIGNSHGNEEFKPCSTLGNGIDALFTFGDKERDYLLLVHKGQEANILTGGIPTNDRLKDLTRSQKHILIITNYLGNRPHFFPVNFNQEFVDKTWVEGLSKQWNLPIVVKQKARLDDPDYEANVSYIKTILDCEVVTSNTESTEQLIADSALVISSLSTLAFKPIQLKVPTILIKGTGQLGNFSDYEGLFNLGNQDFFSYIDNWIPDTRFIQKTLTGGLEFNASEIYANKVKEFYDINC